MREDASGAGKIGTTRRGIGPAYEDKVGRRAIRVCDLAHLDELEPQLDRLCAHHDALRAGFGQPPVDRARLLADLREIAPFVLPYAKPVWVTLNEARKARRRASCSRARRACCSMSITAPIRSSPAPTPLRARPAAVPASAPEARASCSASSRPIPPASAPARSRPSLRTRSARRWACAAMNSAPSPGASAAAAGSTRCWCASPLPSPASPASRSPSSTCFDGFDEIKICTGYMLDGKKFDYLPPHPQDQERVEPIYETMPGWQETTAGARSWADLPAQAIKYIRRVEELMNRSARLHLAAAGRPVTALKADECLRFFIVAVAGLICLVADTWWMGLAAWCTTFGLLIWATRASPRLSRHLQYGVFMPSELKDISKGAAALRAVLQSSARWTLCNDPLDLDAALLRCAAYSSLTETQINTKG
jgi:adenylosuccinate synthase